MRFLKAFGHFWYDFIIGDDWKIAVAVTSALGVLVVVMKTGLLGDHALAVLGGVLVVLLFAASLAIDVRPRGSKRARRAFTGRLPDRFRAARNR